MAEVYSKQKNFAELQIVRIVTIKQFSICKHVSIEARSWVGRYDPNHAQGRYGRVSTV